MSNGRDWTLEEEQIIRQYYCSEGSKEVHKRMPYRTISSIHGKSYRMGIRCYQKKTPFKQWSTQEIKILKQFYPIEGTYCYKRLPNRTRQAIEHRALIEGLSKKAVAMWSQEELDILRNSIGVTNKKLQELLPNRSLLSIKSKRTELKKRGEIILPKRYLSWTPEEVALLQQYYLIEGIECQKRLPNRSKSAIQLCAQYMGLVKLGAWSVAENEILRKNLQLTSKALQELLPGRTEAAIKGQKIQLGFTKKTSQPCWSSEEDALLRRYYPIEGLECKKRLPNRTRQAIKRRATILAIKRIQTEAWTTEEVKILEQFYPIEGPNCYKRLPNRTKSAIRLYARKQGLNKKLPGWSVKEIDTLKKNIGVTREELQKLLPNRTWRAIQVKKLELEMRGEIISPKAPSSWTSEEVAILQHYYPIEGMACQKRLPNRSKRNIQLYAQKIGLGKSLQIWSVEENEILQKNSQLTNKALEKLLPGRTAVAIGRRKTQLGLTKKTAPSWSSEEDALLQHYYPIEGLKCKDRLPNRTPRAIDSRVRRLGLMSTSSSTQWSQKEIDILKRNLALTPKALQKLLPNRTRIAVATKQKQIKKQLEIIG